MTASEESFKILLIGDLHFGESYIGEGAEVLERHGYDYGLEHLTPFVRAADRTIVNLETPLVHPNTKVSPFTGMKKYLHWGDPEHTPAALRRLGVDAVALANNHIVDQGHDAIVSTRQILDRNGIFGFGAGKNRTDSESPYTIDLPNKTGGGSINIWSSFAWNPQLQRDFSIYATHNTPGASTLSRIGIETGEYPKPRKGEFNIVFPHWGGNYAWMNENQKVLARRVVNHGFDLVIGHGSHCMQEFASLEGVLVLFGIGNGVFQAEGRLGVFKKVTGIPPYGAWVMLEVSSSPIARTVSVKVYPVYADNAVIAYKPAPLNSSDFEELIDLYATRPLDPSLNPAKYSTGKDHLGYHFAFDLGEWPAGRAGVATTIDRREKSTSKVDNGRVNDRMRPWESLATKRMVRTPGADEMLESGRHSGAYLVTEAGERRGAATIWVDETRAVSILDGRARLVSGHSGNNSRVAAKIVQDKWLTKQLLGKAGIPTPRGSLVRSPSEAISFADELGCSIVLKPRFSTREGSVLIALSGKEEIERSFWEVNRFGEVLAEEHLIDVDEFHCLASEETCYSALRMPLPGIEGDGESTIRELIWQRNRIHNAVPSTFQRSIPTDSVTTKYLEAQGLWLDTVLPPGRRVTVNGQGGVNRGSEPRAVTESAPTQIRRASTETVAQIPGLDVGGIDILLTRDGVAYILGIDAATNLTTAQFPYEGSPLSTGDIIYDRLVEAPGEKTAHGSSYGNFLIDQRASAGEQLEYRRPRKLAQLIRQVLRQDGWQISRHNHDVIKASDPSGRTRWLTAASTEADRDAVQSVLARHRRVYRFLRNSKVPRMRALLVEGPMALERACERLGLPVIAVPLNSAWGTTVSHVIDCQEQVDMLKPEAPEGLLLQQLPRADERFTVFSDGTPTAPLILGGQDSPTGRIEEATVVAAEAVNSVPGLRWAAVDVFIPCKEREDRTALVEGMSNNPTIQPDELILAGSFNSLWALILDSSTWLGGSGALAVGAAAEHSDDGTPR